MSVSAEPAPPPAYTAQGRSAEEQTMVAPALLRREAEQGARRQEQADPDAVWGRAITALRESRAGMLQMICGEYTRAVSALDGVLTVACDVLYYPMLKKNIDVLARAVSGFTLKLTEQVKTTEQSDEERIKLILGGIPLSIK